MSTGKSAAKRAAKQAEETALRQAQEAARQSAIQAVQATEREAALQAVEDAHSVPEDQTVSVDTAGDNTSVIRKRKRFSNPSTGGGTSSLTI